MTPDDLRTPRYRALVTNTFRADGARDAALFVKGLTPRASFQLGAHPAVVGREAIQAMVADVFRGFRRVDHTLLRAYELEDVLIYEAKVTYEQNDGRVIEPEYVNVLRFEGDLVSDYRIYIDLSVLR